MTRAQRNRNPGNLKFAKQKGAVGKDNAGFAIFQTHIHGWRALIAQVRLDASRGLTIKQFINKYAPPSENDSQAYCSFVCNGLKASPEASLADYHPAAVAGLVAWYEGYFKEIKDASTPK